VVKIVLTYDGLKVPTRTLTDTVNIVDPDIYADIVEFADSSWKPYLKITNNEQQTLYYQVKPKPAATQPPRYTINTTDLGSIANGATTEFTNWAGIACTAANKPAAADIPSGGVLSETCYLRVEAYTDSAYTTSFGYADFNIVFKWIDSASAGWTVVDTDDFDDGTVQGWAGDNAAVVSDVYRSAPYSLRTSGPRDTWISHYKSFTTGAVSNAFAILYYRRNEEGGEIEIRIGGVAKYKFTLPIHGVWFKIVVPIPTNATNELRIRMWGKGVYDVYAWLDNVKVIQS